MERYVLLFYDLYDLFYVPSFFKVVLVSAKNMAGAGVCDGVLQIPEG